jgi:energy-coupling factor transport system ATP-binding protein
LIYPGLCNDKNGRMNLRFENVSFAYENFSSPANATSNQLDDISFAMRPGEVVGMVGRSGSGKTTLMQLCNGLLMPQQGRIVVDEQDINLADYDLTALRRRLGLVFQFPETQLFAATVAEEIAFGPQQQKIAFQEGVTNSLQLVGLSASFAGRNPFTLSQGEKRRVVIASVLAMQPEMLVLDEPTAGLDARGVAGISIILKEWLAPERTLMIISHDVDFIATLCSRILVLEKGRLLYDGTASSLWGIGATLHGQEFLQKANLPMPRYQRLRQHLLQQGIKSECENLAL